MLNVDELHTILVEIEGVINARPLTYVYDDNEGVSYPLTPSHLVNGRNLNRLPNDAYFEICNTYESLSKRAKYNCRMLHNFTSVWKNDYLLGLLEAYYGGPQVHTKFKFVTLNSNSSHQIQIHHSEFKFVTRNSNSSHQIQIDHTDFKFVTSSTKVLVYSPDEMNQFNSTPQIAMTSMFNATPQEEQNLSSDCRLLSHVSHFNATGNLSSSSSSTMSSLFP